jgi:hypothetical protein
MTKPRTNLEHDPTAAAIAERIAAQRIGRAAEIAAAQASADLAPGAGAAVSLMEAFRAQHAPMMQTCRKRLNDPELELDVPGVLRRGELLDLMREMDQILGNIDTTQRALGQLAHLTLAEARGGRVARLQQTFQAATDAPRALEDLWAQFEEAWEKFGHRLGSTPRPSQALLAPDPAPSGASARPRFAKGGLSGDAA